MRRHAIQSIVCVVAVSAFATAGWASDAWKDKKPSDWTEKQMDKFMTSSPWSNTVQPSSNLPMDSGAPSGPGGGGWSGGGGGMGGGGGRGGGGGAMGGGMGASMPIMTYQIRWMSAPIMREALKLSESDALNAAIAKYADSYYVIGVQMQVEGGGGGGGPRGGGGRGGMGGGKNASGGPGGQGGPNGQSGQGAAMERPQQGLAPEVEQMLIRGATLKFGHALIHPEKADMARCGV